MTTISVTDARSKLYKLVDQAREESEPILITGKRGNVVTRRRDRPPAPQSSLECSVLCGARIPLAHGVGGKSEIRNSKSETCVSGSFRLADQPGDIETLWGGP